ncbi:hypothetical protein KA005_12680 [bacterium]|nr:hypothetical protein [bacterium]
MSLFLTLEEHHILRFKTSVLPRLIEKAAKEIAREVAVTYSDGTHFIVDSCGCGGDASDGEACEFCIEVEFYRGLIEKAFK